MAKYYFTYGTDKVFPHYGGWAGGGGPNREVGFLAV